MNRAGFFALLATTAVFAPAAANDLLKQFLSRLNPEDLQSVFGMDHMALSGVMKFNIPADETVKQVPKQDHEALKDEVKKPGAEEHLSADKPKFCNGLDCPEFSVISKTKDYEERHYKQSMWVSTRLQDVSYTTASRKMFMRLFDYISGKNEKQEKIAMTAPVITKLIPGPGPACESDFIMSFYMSTSVKDPPTPSDPTVFLSTLPDQKVFVKSFSGYADEDKNVRNVKDLGEILVKEGKSFNDSVFYSAGYDSPYRFLNRHNEVWLIEN